MQVSVDVAHVRVRIAYAFETGRQSGNGAGLLQVVRFPLPILIPPTAPRSLTILSSDMI
jgi:hypothetical protein